VYPGELQTLPRGTWFCASSATTSRTSHPPTPTSASPPQLPPQPPPQQPPSPSSALPNLFRGNLLSPLSALQFLAPVNLLSSCQGRRLISSITGLLISHDPHYGELLLQRKPGMKTNQRRGSSETSLGNVYHCGLIFHLIRLLVIYPFAGSLPLVYDSSVLLIPPNQFYFPPMFRKTLLDIFGLHLQERIRCVLDQY